jgi:hypothetical protein
MFTFVNTMDKKHNQRHWQDQTLNPTHISRDEILWQPTLHRSSKASRATVVIQTSSYQQQADQMSMQTGRMAGWQVGDMQGIHTAGTQNTLGGQTGEQVSSTISFPLLSDHHALPSTQGIHV